VTIGDFVITTVSEHLVCVPAGRTRGSLFPSRTTTLCPFLGVSGRTHRIASYRMDCIRCMQMPSRRPPHGDVKRPSHGDRRVESVPNALRNQQLAEQGLVHYHVYQSNTPPFSASYKRSAMLGRSVVQPLIFKLRAMVPCSQPTSEACIRRRRSLNSCRVSTILDLGRN
jgi:hypothetical protein